MATIDPIWRCPRCRGELHEHGQKLTCRGCSTEYPIVAGIPDLRIPGPSWIDHDEDRILAERLVEETRGATARQMVRHVYGWRTERDAAWMELRTDQVMAGIPRMTREIREWLDACTAQPGGFLEVGCGNGQLLAAAALQGRTGYGIDVRLVWLVVAKRLIEEAGGTPRLAAAMAEALPLADESMHGLVSLDVIEHVGDVPAYLREIDRVAAPGSLSAFATPNRYSLTAEPHVYIWGVGWVPRRWQKAYVKMRKGISYEYTQLLSVPEAGRLFRRHTQMRPRFIIPQVPPEEIARYKTLRKWVAGAYNSFAGIGLFKPIFSFIGPFFRIVAQKA
jgi:ubiquinone/menaquinone biosynthesis C-methylase UbiE